MPQVKVNIGFDPALLARVDAAAVTAGISRAAWLSRAAEAALGPVAASGVPLVVDSTVSDVEVEAVFDRPPVPRGRLSVAPRFKAQPPR